MFFFGLSFVSDTGDWGRTPKSKINIMKNTSSNKTIGYPELLDAGDFNDIPESNPSDFTASWLIAAVVGASLVVISTLATL